MAGLLKEAGGRVSSPLEYGCGGHEIPGDVDVKNDSGVEFDVAIVGAGAAGLMAALFAGREGSGRVALLETTRDGGRKILISGGGRCNVLPSRLEPAQYVTSSSANSLRKILLSWPLREQIAFFEGAN